MSNVQLVTPAAIQRSYVKAGGLKAFIEVAWPKIDPAPFVGGWHIDEISHHLEAVYRGQVRNLIINIPPGLSKSSVVCVLWPLWVWIQDPRKKFIFASHEPDLALRDARRTRNTIRKDWFQQRWPHLQLPKTEDSTAASRFFTTAMGFRISVGMGQRILGWHADFKAFDDPTKPLDMDGAAEVSKAQVKKTNNDYDQQFSSRNVDVKKTATVVVMQRIHQIDLTGYLLEKARSGEGEEFEQLRLPMEYNIRKPCRTSVGGDRRKKHGELLCPERMDAEAVVILKKKMGTTRIIAAQMDQEPSAAGGNIILAKWLRHWGPCSPDCEGRGCPGPLMERMPPDGEMKLEQSWDLTFDKTSTSDFVCGQVWGKKNQFAFLLPDQVHGRMNFTETIKEFKALTDRHPRAYKKRIEKAANASALANMLQSKVPGIQLEPSRGSKEQYLRASEPMFEAGCVVYPSPRLFPWVENLNWHELLGFPGAKHDDTVDATTHELFHMVQGNAVELMRIGNANLRSALNSMSGR